jgi:hypothetical protein
MSGYSVVKDLVVAWTTEEHTEATSPDPTTFG